MPTRLKSLELHGFKTFASHTEFAFAGMVTAIVGPNGSGKSNIADAIRWVLGEQAYGLLRAKKTEDMIFSGSEHRPRAGMAATTIVFDNSDGWLPIDFVEVAITRRAYRDGQNEYLINGQRVRLKDVSELLAQSGLAERTYTIIGQGLVDAALALKAEDRRRLFEEAAGIGLHRTRREEALRRLDITQRNLERVLDILAELQPRLHSLERQARRLQEYEQVKADLHVILRDWYGYHWHRSQHDLAVSQEVSRKQEANMDHFRQAQMAFNQSLAEIVGKIQAERESLNDWRHKLSELHTQQEQSGRDLLVIHERIHSLSTQQHDTANELVRIGEEAAIQQEQINTVNIDLIRITQELQEARERSDSAETALRTRQQERSLVEQTVQVIRQNYTVLSAQHAHLNARLTEQTAQAERQKGQAQVLEQALKDASVAQRQSEKQLNISENLLTSVKTTQAGLDNESGAIRVQIDRIEKDRLLQLKDQNIQQISLARLQTQVEIMEQTERSLEGYATGARILLQSAQQSRINGVLGALSQQIEVATEYETAIAAILGEYLDAILFNQADQIEKALSLLEGENASSALLPINDLQLKPDGNHPSEFTKDPGSLGLAFQHIKYPKELHAVVELFLGRVIIVQDRVAARRIMNALREQQAFDWRVVTLRGEVFHTNGSILAGYASHTGAISRPRQRQELKEQLEDQRLKSERVDLELKKLDEELKILHSTEDQFRSQLKKMSDEIKQVTSQRNQDELALEKARRSFLWSHEQLDHLVEEKNRSENEINHLRTELFQLESQLESTQQILHQRTADLANLPFGDFQNQHTYWDTRIAVAIQALGDANKRQSDLLAALERSKQTQQTFQEKINDYSSQLQMLARQKDQASQGEVQIGNEIDNLLARIRPVEEVLASLEKQYSSVQNLEAEARQSLSVVEHQYSQSRIIMVRRQEALESLRRRIEDDFGLVAFHYADNVSGPTPLPLDGLVEQLPEVAEIPPELEENIKSQRAQLRRIGPVNLEVQTEYTQVKERFDFLRTGRRSAQSPIKYERSDCRIGFINET